MDKLQGKIALVTGGTSGIGLATARRFVNEGAYVFITGRREAELAAAVKQVGTNVTAVRGDVSNLAGLDRTTTGRLVPSCLFTDPETARVGLRVCEKIVRRLSGIVRRTRF